MKCLRCGKEYKDNSIEVCKECGYDFTEGKRIGKILDNKKDPDVPKNRETDLIDYPILSFVFSILGLIIPLLIFSLLAISFSKKPSKANLIPFSNLGYVFGIIGIAVSSLAILILLILFL